MAVGGTDDVVCIWDLPDHQHPRRFQTPRRGTELRIAFLPDGKLACTSIDTGEVLLWDTDSGELLRQSETFAVSPIHDRRTSRWAALDLRPRRGRPALDAA